MTTALELLTGAAAVPAPMTFPFGRTVYRLRPKAVRDEYSDTDIDVDWSNPDVLPIPGASISQSSTSALAGATREQALEAKSLVCDGAFDVQKGDRIRDGDEGGPVYTIDGIPPAADTNPFTGWTAPREIPLTRAVG
ncbi:hypothetical protein [Rathayibacter sp. VKM Ac-2630]|uniref:hypothetical protein n=1 Tax=Rathayibacter sp. VKM Ac-2630 TaxID=1938617 RepID=UPI000981833B|nr:hypothetical protein [Rathayibacter sp. VKM Ac-2630]OOB90744.1 hypothetical protein B0T42_10070 [Rathayibacter sp. VKM Ac-2630]